MPRAQTRTGGGGPTEQPPPPRLHDKQLRGCRDDRIMSHGITMLARNNRKSPGARLLATTCEDAGSRLRGAEQKAPTSHGAGGSQVCLHNSEMALRQKFRGETPSLFTGNSTQAARQG